MGHVDEMGDEVAADLLRIDEVRHAEALTPRFLIRIEVDADYHIGADEPQALDDIEPNAAETEHNALRARFEFSRY